MTRRSLCARGSRILLILAILFFLLRPFLPLPSVDRWLAVACAAFFLAVQPLVSVHFRRSVVLLTALGLGMFLVFREPLSVLVEGIPYMLNLVVLLTAMQAFSIPISVGHYGQSMGTVLLSGIRRERTLFGVAQVLMTLFSCFTSMGAVVVVDRLLEDSVRDAVENFLDFASCAISRGYLGAILWSPAGITVLMVSGITGVPWAEFFPWCLLLSAAGLVLSVLLQYPGKKGQRLLDTSRYPPFTPEEQRRARRKLVHVSAVAVSMILGVNLFERMLAVSSTHSIVLTGASILLVWLLLLNQEKANRPATRAAVRQYWDAGIPRSFDLGALFIAMGIFTKALSASPIMSFVARNARFLTDNGVLFLVLVPAVILLLSLPGVHPFITVSLAGNILQACTTNVSMLSIAVALIFGASAAYIVSPLAGVTLALSKVLDRPPKTIAGKNGAYTTVFYIVGVLASLLLR